MSVKVSSLQHTIMMEEIFPRLSTSNAVAARGISSLVLILSTFSTYSKVVYIIFSPAKGNSLYLLNVPKAKYCPRMSIKRKLISFELNSCCWNRNSLGTRNEREENKRNQLGDNVFCFEMKRWLRNIYRGLRREF